jgi:hypothetical protein
MKGVRQQSAVNARSTGRNIARTPAGNFCSLCKRRDARGVPPLDEGRKAGAYERRMNGLNTEGCGDGISDFHKNA